MNTLQGLLDVAWSERLGWTIIHSFWQIAAVTAVYAGAAVWLRRGTANMRYVLGCLALGAMVWLPFLTFALLDTRQMSIAAIGTPLHPLSERNSAQLSTVY